jgi:hypothetical protein
LGESDEEEIPFPQEANTILVPRREPGRATEQIPKSSAGGGRWSPILPLQQLEPGDNMDSRTRRCRLLGCRDRPVMDGEFPKSQAGQMFLRSGRFASAVNCVIDAYALQSDLNCLVGITSLRAVFCFERSV